MSEKEIKGQKKVGGDHKDSYEERNISEQKEKQRKRDRGRKDGNVKENDEGYLPALQNASLTGYTWFI